MNGKATITPKPETEEYNVRNFVYKRHRPFHPERLWKLVHDKFILQLEHNEDEEGGAVATSYNTDQQQAVPVVENSECDDDSMEDVHTRSENTDWDDLDTDTEGEVSMSAGSAVSSSAETALTSPLAENQGLMGVSRDTRMDFVGTDADSLATPDKHTVLANKRAHPLFGRLFRSKGTYWLATRPDYRGIWSQAGAMLTLVGGTRWDITLTPEEVSQLYHEDTTDAEIMRQVRHDMESGGEWGDRRQEIVLIGEKLDIEGIEKVLDECLLTNIEWKRWKRRMRSVGKLQAELRGVMERLDGAKENLIGELADAFPEWEAHFQDEEIGQDEEEDGDQNGHDSHQH